MNFLHMKYAVEIADTNSINKAADRLYVGQSAISRAIKELEADLGVTLFERSAKGMFLTAEGDRFIRYARQVLRQVEEIETMFQSDDGKKKRFSLSGPRSSYVAEAFARFSGRFDASQKVDIFYRETTSIQTVKNITSDEFKVGIVRYAEEYNDYYKQLLDEKLLSYELINTFHYVLAMNRECPLAELDEIHFDDLKDFMEIAHADPEQETLPFATVKKKEIPDIESSKIFVFDRSSQFELLSRNKNAYMWVSPVPQNLLDHYGLVQIVCPDNQRQYKDLLIYRKNHTLSEYEKWFVEDLVAVKREIAKNLR